MNLRETAKEALEAATSLKEEVEAFAEQARLEGPSAALRLRGIELKKRIKQHEATAERLTTLEQGVAIAYRQRTGKEPVTGDTITAEDDARGQVIAAALMSKPTGQAN